MSQSPEEIRAEIERTRGQLGTDVDAVANRVNPSNIAHRQGQKVQDRVNKVKNSVMGSADSAGDSTKGKAQSAKDSAHDAGQAFHDAPHTVARKAEGNPLAAGLIAFGAGLLVSSLIPASKAESDAARSLKDKAQPLVHEVQDAGKQVAEGMKEPAREAAESVKSTATDAAGHVKDEGTSAAEDVKGRAGEARNNVQNQR